MDRIGRNGTGSSFDRHVSLGQIAGILTIIGSCLSVRLVFRHEVRDGHGLMETSGTRVLVPEQSRADLPKIEDQIRTDRLQNRRIQNLTDALNALRTMMADLTRVVAGQSDLIHDVHERQAVLEERIGTAAPHDR